MRRTNLGALANGLVNFRCIRPESRINPNVAAKESCRLKLAIEYGLRISSNPKAKNSEFRLPDSFFSTKAPAAIKYMIAARSTDGVAPAIGTNSTMSGIDRYVPSFRPNSRKQKPTKKPICRPDTATKWLSPAIRSANASASERPDLSPSNKPFSNPACREGRCVLTASRQKRAIRWDIHRRERLFCCRTEKETG